MTPEQANVLSAFLEWASRDWKNALEYFQLERGFEGRDILEVSDLVCDIAGVDPVLTSEDFEEDPDDDNFFD